MNRLRLLLSSGLLLLTFFLNAQKLPYSSEISAFKTQDSILFPAKHAILFIGSSSFTKWTDVQDYFPGHKIINRGFGGSRLVDQIQYVNEVVFPYKPKQIVIYCGENDIASSDTITPQTVFKRFVHLFTLIRSKLPKASIVFVSLKPSPSREKFDANVKETNSLIREFLRQQKKTAFVDVYSKMVDSEGKSRPELFVSDMLHMNKQGYAIWKEMIEPYLLKK